MIKDTKRKNTKLESEGAEFLVLGNLLVEGIDCYKSYVNFPDYDVVAINPNGGKVAKIQVKSRWATNYDKMFLIKNFDCDFVVHVALNRGYCWTKKDEKGGQKEPAFYVFPCNLVKNASKHGQWNKVKISDIKDYEKYKNNWGLVREFLKE